MRYGTVLSGQSLERMRNAMRLRVVQGFQSTAKRAALKSAAALRTRFSARHLETLYDAFQESRLRGTLWGCQSVAASRKQLVGFAEFRLLYAMFSTWVSASAAAPATGTSSHARAGSRRRVRADPRRQRGRMDETARAARKLSSSSIAAGSRGAGEAEDAPARTTTLVDAVFAYADADRDGFIGFDEFVRVMSVVCFGELNERLDFLFRVHGARPWQHEGAASLMLQQDAFIVLWGNLLDLFVDDSAGCDADGASGGEPALTPFRAVVEAGRVALQLSAADPLLSSEPVAPVVASDHVAGSDGAVASKLAEFDPLHSRPPAVPSPPNAAASTASSPDESAPVLLDYFRAAVLMQPTLISFLSEPSWRDPHRGQR